MESNTIQESSTIEQNKDSNNNEHKKSKSNSKVNSQTDSNKMNSDISTAITPNHMPNEKENNNSTDNLNTTTKNDEIVEKMDEGEQNDNSIYTKEELELSLFEMLEVTRINLECQLESNPDNTDLTLKLIDTRK